MVIGILREPEGEKRVSLLPGQVKLLSEKNKILVEEGIDWQGIFKASDFTEAGASLESGKNIFKAAEILLSVTPPSVDDINSLDSEKILISLFNPLSDHEQVKILKEKGLTTFSLELIPRITRAQSMDVLSSMATIAGYKAVLTAANLLPRFFPMFMSAAGTIKPAKVLILGAGVAGLQAIAIARKLGAVVEVFDVRSAVRDEVSSLGGKFIEVEGATEDKAAGGYAVEQTEDFKDRQAQLIHDHAVKSDVIICTAQIPGKKAPLLIKKETVEAMRDGSVIVDLAASSGGNCEVSENEKMVSYKNKTIVGTSNYASEMANDASLMFGNNLMKFLQLLVDSEGNLNLNFEDEIIKSTCLTHKGEIINQRVKELLT